ncbi:UbiD family decarboxylase [Chloroflexota bacterium]
MKKNKDLRDFLNKARQAGPDYYLEAKKPVDPDLVPGILQQKLAKQGRFPVFFCPEINGSKIPMVSNLFGSYELLAMALGIDPSQTGTNVDEATFFPYSDRGEQRVDKAQLFQEFRKRLANGKPVEEVPASEAPVKEVVLKGKDVDLGILPITRHGKEDSEKYITIGCIVAKDPDTGIANVGVYRHEIKGKDKLGIGVNPAHHMGYIGRRCAELGKPMEVAIFIGHHPSVIMASQAKGGLDLNEMELMGGLLGEPLLVTCGETVDLPVPAWAEIVIEGVVDTSKIYEDGPFAEYTGYYGEKGERAVYLTNVTAITMRKDAIYHDLVPNHPELNLCTVLFYESSAYDVVKRIVPTVKAVHYPLSGTCALNVYVSIRKRIQGEGKLAGIAALASDFTTNIAVIVDEDIDVYNEQEVMWAIATRVFAHRDISIIPGVTGSDLYPASYSEQLDLPPGHVSTKVIIDATRPISGVFSRRITPDEDRWKSVKLSDYVDLP